MHVDKTESFAQWISEEIGVNAYAPANENYLLSKQ